MSKLDKILTIIFILLFVVLVVEVYYLLTSSKGTNSKEAAIIYPPTAIPTSPPFPTSDLSDKLSDTSSSTFFAELTQDDINGYKKLIDEKMITSSILETKYSGKIQDIAFSSVKDEDETEYTDFSFNLNNNDNIGQKIPVKFNKFVFNKIEIVQIINNKEIPIDMKSLKNGDSVKIVFSINLLYDYTNANYLNHMKIIKI